MLKKSILAIVMIGLFMVPQAWAQDVIKLDLNAVYGATSFHTIGAIEFAKLADKYSNGSVKITVHPGGSSVSKVQSCSRSSKMARSPCPIFLWVWSQGANMPLASVRCRAWSVISTKPNNCTPTANRFTKKQQKSGSRCFSMQLHGPQAAWPLKKSSTQKRI